MLRCAYHQLTSFDCLQSCTSNLNLRVKMCVISEVEPKTSVPVKPDTSSDLRILLKRHTYQAGLWDADEMGQHQYLEGARRQVERWERFSSVNDGAPWIDRITTSNFPR